MRSWAGGRARPLTDDEVDRLTAMDIVARDGAAPDGDAYRVDAGLLRLGVEPLDVPFSPRRSSPPVRPCSSTPAPPRATCRTCCATRSPNATRGTSGPCPPTCTRSWCRRC